MHTCLISLPAQPPHHLASSRNGRILVGVRVLLDCDPIPVRLQSKFDRMTITITAAIADAVVLNFDCNSIGIRAWSNKISSPIELWIDFDRIAITSVAVIGDHNSIKFGHKLTEIQSWFDVIGIPKIQKLNYNYNRRRLKKLTITAVYDAQKKLTLKIKFARRRSLRFIITSSIYYIYIYALFLNPKYFK